MALNTDAIGKTYAPTTYAVGREKIREYAAAVGETNPLHHDLDAARAAGYEDLVAPPMFVVVYAARSVGPAVLDPDVGINLMMMVHGGQEFRWGPVVVARDEITTTSRSRTSPSAAGWASTCSSRSRRTSAARPCARERGRTSSGGSREPEAGGRDRAEGDA